MTAAKSAAEGGFGRLLQLCVSGSGAMNSRLRLSHNSFAPLILRLVSESQIAQTAILREILGVEDVEKTGAETEDADSELRRGDVTALHKRQMHACAGPVVLREPAAVGADPVVAGGGKLAIEEVRKKTWHARSACLEASDEDLILFEHRLGFAFHANHLLARQRHAPAKNDVVIAVARLANARNLVDARTSFEPGAEKLQATVERNDVLGVTGALLQPCGDATARAEDIASFQSVSRRAHPDICAQWAAADVDEFRLLHVETPDGVTPDKKADDAGRQMQLGAGSDKGDDGETDTPDERSQGLQPRVDASVPAQQA